MTKHLDRRAFLQRAAQSACCLSAAPLLGQLSLLQARANALPPGPYQALVCLYLAGGHDSFNMLVPRSGADQTAYAATRDALAVPSAQVLQLSPVTATGRDFGLHPSCADLQALFAAGQLAFVANVGPLVAPMTRTQYQNGSVAKPKNLFSHSDQTTLWQSQSARPDTAYGWAGRTADVVLPLNNGSALSPAITVAGQTRLLRGQTVAPYAMTTSGTVTLSGTSGTDGQRRLAALQRVLTQTHGHAMERAFAQVREEAIALDGLIRTSLDAAPPLQTVFPDTSLGRQLRMVARMIGIRQPLGQQRQVFFVRLDGFDTHDGQLTQHPLLLTVLGQACAAFQAAMTELATAQNVTLFTISEFGRTLTSNGRGTDHGWGGVQFVLGGAVRGRDIYGTMPGYAVGGPDDAGSGRIIPTIAVDQYAATLAKWFGLLPADLAAVFPRLSQFATSDLGFL